MATLAFTIKLDGIEDDSLVVRSFDGQESLSSSLYHGEPCYGFRYQVELASRRSDLLPEDIVDMAAELKMYRNGQLTQRVHGVVRQFSQGDIGHHHTFYSLTLVPAFERLSLRQNSRIFQKQTAPEIISVLLQEMGIHDYSFAIAQNYQQREFCVQYRETDLAFVQRLAAEEGLVYSFEHAQGEHTIVFSDSTDLLPSLDMPIPYNALSGGAVDIPYISGIQARTQSQVSSVELKDYSFKKPEYGFNQNQLGSDIEYQQDGYEHFDYPGRYKNDDSGKAFSRIRLEYLRRQSRLAFGKSNQPLLRAGCRFTLQEHLNPEFNRNWLVVNIVRQGTQPQALEESGGAGATTYNNRFEIIPANQTWRAEPQARPQVDGPMMALVVGPEGEEIFCDEHGRVKLHFPWDRYSSGNEHSSCWVRVSQGWAGSQYGMMAIPRIGHEVIVSFLNGDPDQPIVTGRTYHVTNTTPYVLPEHKTKTILRSETHQGEGFNELSFEDQAQAEKIYLHAQKDFEADVLNDHTTHIKHDMHLTVDNDRFTKILNNRHLTVEGESRSKVSKDQTTIVDGSMHHKVANLHALEAGNEVHLKSGAKIVVEAGAEMTLKVGGSFVKIDPAGVHIVGAAINLNSGGSAGSGSGYGGQLAALPLGVEAVAAPDQTLYAPITAYMASLLPALSDRDLKAAELCQKRMDGSCTQSDCECK